MLRSAEFRHLLPPEQLAAMREKKNAPRRTGRSPGPPKKLPDTPYMIERRRKDRERKRRDYKKTYGGCPMDYPAELNTNHPDLKEAHQ